VRQMPIEHAIQSRFNFVLGSRASSLEPALHCIRFRCCSSSLIIPLKRSPVNWCVLWKSLNTGVHDFLSDQPDKGRDRLPLCHASYHSPFEPKLWKLLPKRSIDRQEYSSSADMHRSAIGIKEASFQLGLRSPA